MLFIVSSLLFSIFLLALWKKHNFLSLLYAHLFFALIPIATLAIKIKCSPAFQNSWISFCTMLFSKFVIYFLPAIIIITAVIGFFFIPKFYQKTSQRHKSKSFEKLCKKTRINADLFLIDKSKPEAFSTGKNIFLTVGLFEILNKSEREAVILHELSHVKSHSSLNKFSELFVKTFSPIAWFSSKRIVKCEEIKADNFAAEFQKTNKFLESAKIKIKNYLST